MIKPAPTWKGKTNNMSYQSRKYQQYLLLLSLVCVSAPVVRADIGVTYFTNFTTTENYNQSTQSEPINVKGTFTVDGLGDPIDIGDFTSWNFTFSESKYTFVLTPANSAFKLLGSPSVKALTELEFQAPTNSDGFDLSGVIDDVNVEWRFTGDLTTVFIDIPNVGDTLAGLPLTDNQFTLPLIGGPGPVATPEPSSVFLVGIGGLYVVIASVLKMLRRREYSFSCRC